MKKLTYLLVIFALLVSFTSCGPVISELEDGVSEYPITFKSVEK